MTCVYHSIRDIKNDPNDTVAALDDDIVDAALTDRLMDQEKRLSDERSAGRFSRAIVKIQGAEGLQGSGTVVGDVNGHYVLMTVSHLVENASHVIVRAPAPDDDVIGLASVVVRRRQADGPDLALLVLPATATRGGRLTPLKMLLN